MMRSERLSKAGEINPEHQVDVLRAWGQYGREIAVNQSGPAWEATAPLIKATKELEVILRHQFDEVLQESEKRLTPLEDPLRINFANNRWFAGVREEGYSDWLAWILQQIRSPELVFRLLAIDEMNVTAVDRNATPIINRELYVEEGHEGQSGRVDVLIWYKNMALINVEVKVTKAESADLFKNSGYANSLEKYGGRKIHILLVTEATQDTYDGYRVLTWANLCIALRRIVASNNTGLGLLTSSLMLGFAGAIEQNLLGFPCRNNQLTGNQNRVLEHLQRCF